MKRREVLKISAALSTAGFYLPAFAHHGWSSFDQDRPIYLEGNSISKSSVHFVGFSSRTLVLSPSSLSRSRMTWKWN